MAQSTLSFTAEGKMMRYLLNTRPNRSAHWMMRSAFISAVCLASVAPSAQSEIQQPASHVVAYVPNGELLFVPISPCRAIDPERIGPLEGTRLLSVIRTTRCVGRVPVAAAGVALSLTVSDASTTGSLIAYPPGAKAATNTASLWYSPGVSKTAQVSVGIEGGSVFLRANSGSVNVTGDVTGYFMPQIAGTSAGYGTRRFFHRVVCNSTIVSAAEPNKFAEVFSNPQRGGLQVLIFAYASDGSIQQTSGAYQVASQC